MRHRLRVIKQFLSQELRSKDFSIEVPFVAWPRGFRAWSYKVYKAYGVDAKQCIPEVPLILRTSNINGNFNRICSDKLLFERTVGVYGPVPPNLGILDKGRFVALIPDHKGETIRSLLERYRDQKGLVFKPIAGSKGSSVEAVRFLDGQWMRNSEPIDFDALLRDLEKRTQSLVMEYVLQAEYARNVYPHSCNTIRLVTFVDPETNDPWVVHAMHRFGTNRSRPVDNVTSGGLWAPIDLESGQTIRGLIRDDIRGWIEIQEHPDTKAPLVGIQIPHWHELLESIKQVLRDVQVLKYVGWDIVVTDDGYVILEGNEHMSQVTTQVDVQLLADPRTRRFFEYYGVI